MIELYYICLMKSSWPTLFKLNKTYLYDDASLIVCGFTSQFRVFHSWKINIIGEGLLTYARHSWPLGSKGSLVYHTYCDTGHLFIMVISEDPWHLRLLPSVWQWSCQYLFLPLRSVASGIQAINLPHARRML